MTKVWIWTTSRNATDDGKYAGDGEVVEVDSLDHLITELDVSVVVDRPDKQLHPDASLNCDWIVEIYDDYRE